MTIRLDQPRRFDLVGNPILIGGIGTGFEATITYRVHEGGRQRAAQGEHPGAARHADGEGCVGYREHVVKKGDMLTKIARRHYGNTNFERSCAPTSARSTIPT